MVAGSLLPEVPPRAGLAGAASVGVVTAADGTGVAADSLLHAGGGAGLGGVRIVEMHGSGDRVVTTASLTGQGGCGGGRSGHVPCTDCWLATRAVAEGRVAVCREATPLSEVCRKVFRKLETGSAETARGMLTERCLIPY